MWRNGGVSQSVPPPFCPLYAAWMTDPSLAAKLLFDQHGADAAVRVCDLHATACMKARDLEGHATWRSIATAIRALQQPPVQEPQK